jgi:hypothetical protein
MLPRLFAWLRGWRVVCVVLAVGTVSWLVQPAPANYVAIGRVTDFPPGSVTHLRLPAAFDDPLRPHYRWGLPLAIGRDSTEQLLATIRLAVHQQLTPPVGQIAPVPIYLVREADGTLTVLYDRDPLTACRLDWAAAARRFEDRCSYSAYSSGGGYLRGPAARTMDRFAVVMLDSGELVVDLDAYQTGAFHQ